MSSTGFQSGFHTDKSSSRVLQPPGGSSSGIFGGGDAQSSPAQKTNTRMTSNIFGAAEADSTSRKVNTRMQSDIFGTGSSAPPSQQSGRADRMKSNVFGGEAEQAPPRRSSDRMKSDIFKEPSPSDQVMPRKLKGKEEDLYAEPQLSPDAGVYMYDGGKDEPDHTLDRAYIAEDQAGKGDAWADDESMNPSHHITAVIHDAPAPSHMTTAGGEGGQNIFDVRYGYTPQKPGRRQAHGTQPDMAATFLNLFGTIHPDGPDIPPQPTAQPPAPTNMPPQALGYKATAPKQPTHQRAAAGVSSGVRDARGPSAVFPEEQRASSGWRPSAKYKHRYQAALVNPITGETYASPDFDPTTNGTVDDLAADASPLDSPGATEKPSTKVIKPPGGGSQITFG